MPPPVLEQRWLAYHYTNLGRWTYFGWWTPSSRAEMPWLPVHTTWQMNLLWLMDPPGTRAEMPWIPVHNTLQMNWLCPMDPQGNRAEMPSHCYWHIVVKNGNFTLLLTSSGQEWQFHIATDILWSRMAISHCYWHLVVKNGNFTLLLTSSGQEWQFHIATDI